jgi:uncharacterized membrane protein (UPF0127 family)
MKAFNRSSGKDLALRLWVAATVLSRARGLLGRRGLEEGEGLLITPCKGVHTFLMRFPIDVVFLDRENRIIHTVAHLQPHRMTRVLLRSSSVIELPAGTIFNSGSAVGHQVVIE